MSKTQHIRIEDYDYPLPDERIAKFPLQQRDSSQLLVYKEGAISQYHFADLPSQLPQDVMLVFNNTRVIQARMHFRKATGALIEILRGKNVLFSFHTLVKANGVRLVQQTVPRQNRIRLSKFFMSRRLSATKIIIIHRRKVIMN